MKKIVFFCSKGRCRSLEIRFVLTLLLSVFFITSSGQGFSVIGGIPHLPAFDINSISEPEPGMLIYSITDESPMIFSGVKWVGLCDNEIREGSIEDYFVVKEGMPYMPVKSYIDISALSGTVYYSTSEKSTMIFNGTHWVRISDMSDCNFLESVGFSTETGAVKTFKLPVLDEDPEISDLCQGVFYVNRETRSIRYYTGNEWRNISCIAVIETLDVKDLNDLIIVSGGNILSNSGSAVTSRGICWDVKPRPTINLDTKTSLFLESGF